MNSLKAFDSSKATPQTEQSYEHGYDDADLVLVRFNGVSSSIDGAKTEFYANKTNSANTSCSIFAVPSNAGSQPEKKPQKLFHLLVDIGNGVVDSLQNGITDVNSREKALAEALPDAILISHAHGDHISDLARLVTDKRSSNGEEKIQIYCTENCRDQITQSILGITNSGEHGTGTSERMFQAPAVFTFNTIIPGQPIEIGPFKVIAVSADHSTDKKKEESAIFVIQKGSTKVITGWDFRSINGADESLFWNPSLLVLGTESYNQHAATTGMISVSDAFAYARRWNAKESFLVHYSGIADLDDARNQWFMGPKKPMDHDELQRHIDNTLKMTGAEGKFRVTAALQGMIWSSKEYHDRSREYYSSTMQQSEDAADTKESAKLGTHIEIETLDSFVLRFDTLEGGAKLRLTIEDRIKSFEPEFEMPRRNQESNLVTAKSIKGMFAKGPDLTLRLLDSDGSAPDPDMPASAFVEVDITKGKKTVFHEVIPVAKHDVSRLAEYIAENIEASPQLANMAA